MKIKKNSRILVFFIIILSAISAFSLIYLNSQNFNGSNLNVVYAEGERVIYDNFDLESLPYNITSDYETGWKTFDGRDASLSFYDGTAVAEEGIFFELNSDARNSYYRNVSLVENEAYNFSLVHRGRVGADTLALIIGEAQQDDNSQIVNPTVNSSSLDQFMQMTDWLVSNNYLTAKVGVDPSIIVYSNKFSSAGGFVGDSGTNFSLEPTEECSEKWTIIFITTNYYEWVEHNYVYTPESSTEFIVALTHVKARGKNSQNQAAKTGEGNLIRSFSIKNSIDDIIYSCDESNISDAIKTTINSKGYTNINSANNSSPYSADIWNVTEAKSTIELGRANFNSYAISNLSQIAPVEGDAFLLSQGVYKDFDFSDLTTDYFNVTFFNNSRYQQLFRIIALPKEVQITTDNYSMISQIDYIEQYINADTSLKTSPKLTIYTSSFDANGLFDLPLSEAFSLQKKSKHPIKVDIYNFYSSTSWNELNAIFDNTEGTYNNGIKICFGGCGLDQVASIFLDSITVESCTFNNTFEGSGSSSAPYKIQTAEEFALFRKIVYSGRKFNDVFFEQTADLEFDGIKLDCVVGNSPNFAGVYNGKGYTLSNITMDYSNYTSITNTRSSIFYNVSGSIINLGLEDSSFLGQYVSTFADNLNGYGNISNCYANNVTVGGTGSSWGAGIALIVTGNATLENIYFNGTLTGLSDANNYGVASYRSKTCNISNICTTSTTLLKPVTITARTFSNCAIKTEEELKSEEVLTLLNAYATEYGFNFWISGDDSFPKITQNIAGISLKSFSVTDTIINETINCYYSPEDGEYYLLLPNYFDISNLAVSYTIFTEDVTNAYLEIYNIDNDSKIYDVSQGSYYDFSDLGRFKVKIGDSNMSKDYIFNLMQGGNASIFISLENGDFDLSNIDADVNHNTWTTGVAKIIDNDGNIESQQIKEIKGRGNFSWGLSKRPYQVKFEKSFSMFGMKKSKTWLLIANHTDGSLARTATWYELSTWFGIDYSVEFEVANVYINGNYNGMYLITSKVQVDKNRINVSDDDYLIEIDNTVDDYQFKTDRNSVINFTVKNPDFDDLNAEERELKLAEIKSYIEFIEDKIYDQSVTFAELSTYLDMESFAKYYWIQELSLNYDAMYGSSYMYTTTDVETGEKILHMGPIWDMDNTLGFYAKITADYSNLKYYNLLNDSFGAVGKRVRWYNQLMQRQEFSDLIDEVFIKNYKTALSYSENEDGSYSGIVGFVVNYLENTNKSALMNYSKWSYTTMKSEQTYWMGGNTYQEACTNLINYLKARIDFYYGEYKDVMYKSIIIEYVDKDGFKTGLTRDVNNIGDIILPANINKDEPIVFYGINYNNEIIKVDEIILTNGVYTGKLYYAQNTSIAVENKTSNRTSFSIDMSIQEPILNEIVIDSMPSKLNYFIGQEFDKSGMVVKGIYSDGTTEVIDDYQILYESFVEGENVVAITYAKRSTTLTITAEYVVITWIDDNDNVVDTQNLIYGQMPTYNGPALSKDCENPEAYTMHWDSEITQATEDKTYKAVFELKTYIVQFYNGSTWLQDVLVAHGFDAVYTEATPTKVGDAQYRYEFDKWVTTDGGSETAIISNITSNKVVYASFKQIVNLYDIIFKDENGNDIEIQQSLAYGTIITPPEAPTKTATAEYTYSFAGWTPEITTVEGNATYTATYTATVREYTITWKNGETILNIDNVKYSELPKYTGETPTKNSTAEYTYIFAGWTPEVNIVVDNAIYTTKFTEIKNKYQVTFIDYNGNILSKEVLDYGTTIVAPANPTRQDDKQYTYTFAGWNNTVAETVTEDIIYTATYTSTLRTYTITWKNGDTILKAEQLEYGTIPNYIGEEPKKEVTAEYTYEFSGWSPAIEAVKDNAEYVANFTATKNKYTITWKNEETVLSTDILEYGSLPAYSGVEPTKSQTKEYTYMFNGWSPSLTNVTEDTTYTAQFKEQKNKYLITFKDFDGRIIKCEVLDYGTPISLPTENPTRPSSKEYTYTFDKWLNYEENMLVIEDVEFIASYSEQAIKNTTVKDETFNVEIDLDESLANEISLKVVQQDNVVDSQTILNNKYENISNLVVYKISLIDNNQSETYQIDSYAKIKIQVPENIDKKNLVIYNLTTQKAMSFEIFEDYAVCELNSLGEIALFNNQNISNNNSESSQSINIIIVILVCSNVILFVVCIIIICKRKSKKRF